MLTDAPFAPTLTTTSASVATIGPAETASAIASLPSMWLTPFDEAGTSCLSQIGTLDAPEDVRVLHARSTPPRSATRREPYYKSRRARPARRAAAREEERRATVATPRRPSQ